LVTRPFNKGTATSQISLTMSIIRDNQSLIGLEQYMRGTDYDFFSSFFLRHVDNNHDITSGEISNLVFQKAGKPKINWRGYKH